jgi:bacitracin synthase 3
LAETFIIGKPVKGYHIYILDENREMMPLGRTGEICIEGGLARGYLNLPDLTREKFIANPFNPEARLYCTGDLGRFTGDGDIEYRGRCDHQVKIRGHRVELEEVERVIDQYPDVITAGVVLGAATDYLTAYLTVKITFNEPAFRRHLGMHLPAYMIPSRIKILDRMPLTASGKIDRVWLGNDAAKYTKAFTEGPSIMPQSKMEELLLSIWQEILGRNDFDVTHNFFDLGGHSIKAHQLQNRIYQELAVEVKLAEVFIYPTIQQLASLIEQIEQHRYRYIDIL